uniref:30S ribosomal protein S10 n=1 Tax=Monodopsis sp. MarTras21 TaxID=1745953 RepID=A0A140F2W3_9STRA|nr:30S ribosomal protein S10 [Monodopsis sp. MarTras21]
MNKNKYPELLLRFQTHNKKSSDKFKKALYALAKCKNLEFSSIDLPVERKKVTLLKSPHVNKKAKDQFETRLYNGLIVLRGYPFDDKILQLINSMISSDLLLKLSYKSYLC